MDSQHTPCHVPQRADHPPVLEADAAFVRVDARATAIRGTVGALERLAALRPRAAQVLELRYFGGLSQPEIASYLAVSLPTVARDWQAARIWLRSKLSPA